MSKSVSEAKSLLDFEIKTDKTLLTKKMIKFMIINFELSFRLNNELMTVNAYKFIKLYQRKLFEI